jgi:hypothetical protein
MSEFGKGGKVQQCGCIEGTSAAKPVIRRLACQGGVKTCGFFKACMVDGITEELQDEAILKESMAEDEMVKRVTANFMDKGFYDLNGHGRLPKRLIG